MLLLRKECQGALDALGFIEAHVEVQEKQLVIVGECGNTIITLPSITFYNTKVTKAEREYAVILFNKALTKYRDDFKLFREAREALPEQPKEPKGFGVRYGTLKYKVGTGTISLNPSGSINMDNIKVSSVYYQDITEYKDAANKVKELGNKIARCTI
jgi:hypothetical protein